MNFLVDMPVSPQLVTRLNENGQILALSHASDPGVILFRGGNYSDQEMLGLLKRVLDRYPEQKLSHAVTVVDKKRMRRCPLPIE